MGEEMYQRKLLAVATVDENKRVRCQHPGCKQTIYKSVHVINDEGTIKVIGSTCITKGGYGDLGEAAYTGSGGDGKTLSDEERELLANNTEELVRRLQAQYHARLLAEEQARAAAEAAEAAKREASIAKFQAIKERMAENNALLAQMRASRPVGPAVNPGSGQRSQVMPWAWADPMRSILFMELEDGTRWLRVQAKPAFGGKHHLVPYPVYEGWDEILPSQYGQINASGDGYELTNLVQAIQYMRGLRPRRESVCSSFADLPK